MSDIFSDIWAHRMPRDPKMHPKHQKADKREHKGATGYPNKAKKAQNDIKMDPRVLKKQPLLDSLIQ